MADQYRNVSSHALTLASGQPLAPGDAGDTDMTDPHDKALRDEGRLAKVDTRKTTSKKGSR